MKFCKYTSAGNDFVIFDKADCPNSSDISSVCDRRFGIGADGVLIYSPSSEYDFEMIYYNADGGEVEMCGNGARALCHYARNFSKNNKSLLSFKTHTGSYQAEFLTENLIKMSMTEINRSELNLEDLIPDSCKYVEVGVPHVVIFDKDYDEGLAKNIRYDSRFSAGTNVSFVKKLSDEKYTIRTYERGVEGETLACGTGVTAAGIFILEELNRSKGKIFISAKGGDFEVEISNQQYFLIGPTQFVFSGELPNKEA